MKNFKCILILTLLRVLNADGSSSSESDDVTGAIKGYQSFVEISFP